MRRRSPRRCGASSPFAGDAVLVAHNARFDMAFLDNETMRLTGRRVAATVVDTVGLARELLGRQPANLAALSYRFATERAPVPPRAARRRGDGRDPALPDRDGAGARRDAPSPTSSSSRRRGRGACSASAASPSARRSSRASTSSATCTTRCSTSAARATCARGCARTSARSGSGPRSRRRSARSSASSGACSAPSSKPRSRSCG